MLFEATKSLVVCYAATEDKHIMPPLASFPSLLGYPCAIFLSTAVAPHKHPAIGHVTRYYNDSFTSLLSSQDSEFLGEDGDYHFIIVIPGTEQGGKSNKYLCDEGFIQEKKA